MDLNRNLIGVVAILFVGCSGPAHAYLDPGTGSMVLQLILGGIAGALVVIKLYWHRFMSFFRRGENTSQSDDQ